MLPSTRTPARHAALVAAVLLALVFAQSLGVLHRLTHGPAVGPAATHEAALVDGQAQEPAADGLQALFSGHDQDGACQLYDQLTHADALWSVPAIPWPALEPLPPRERHAAWHLAAQSAGFLARGPPALS